MLCDHRTLRHVHVKNGAQLGRCMTGFEHFSHVPICTAPLSPFSVERQGCLIDAGCPF